MNFIFFRICSCLQMYSTKHDTTSSQKLLKASFMTINLKANTNGLKTDQYAHDTFILNLLIFTKNLDMFTFSFY